MAGATFAWKDFPDGVNFCLIIFSPSACAFFFWVESVLCIFRCLARSTAPDVTAVTAGQRLLADESEDESEFTEKDERRDLENLQRIANALVEFYGLGDVIWLRIYR